MMSLRGLKFYCFFIDGGWGGGGENEVRFGFSSFLLGDSICFIRVFEFGFFFRLFGDGCFLFKGFILSVMFIFETGLVFRC